MFYNNHTAEQVLLSLMLSPPEKVLKDVEMFTELIKIARAYETVHDFITNTTKINDLDENSVDIFNPPEEVIKSVKFLNASGYMPHSIKAYISVSKAKR